MAGRSGPAVPFPLQARNAVPDASLHVVDRGVSSTRWRRDRIPKGFRGWPYVGHEGGADLARRRAYHPGRARHAADAGFPELHARVAGDRAARPDTRGLVVGGPGASYEPESRAEAGHLIDRERVHSPGRLPFALSWSPPEAMAMGVTVGAADVAPCARP